MVLHVWKLVILPKCLILFQLTATTNLAMNPSIQTHGTAMGTKMAPTYENISMWNFEKYMLDNSTVKPFLYLCYIDDIFVAWRHGEGKLEQFHAYVNSIHPNINLTLTSSASDMPHLVFHPIHI